MSAKPITPNYLDKIVAVVGSKTNWGSKLLKADILQLNLEVSNSTASDYEKKVASAIIQDIVTHIDTTGNPTFGRPALMDLVNQFIRNQTITVYHTITDDSF